MHACWMHTPDGCCSLAVSAGDRLHRGPLLHPLRRRAVWHDGALLLLLLLSPPPGCLTLTCPAAAALLLHLQPHPRVHLPASPHPRSSPPTYRPPVASPTPPADPLCQARPHGDLQEAHRLHLGVGPQVCGLPRALRRGHDSPAVSGAAAAAVLDGDGSDELVGTHAPCVSLMRMKAALAAPPPTQASHSSPLTGASATCSPCPAATSRA